VSGKGSREPLSQPYPVAWKALPCAGGRHPPQRQRHSALGTVLLAAVHPPKMRHQGVPALSYKCQEETQHSHWHKKTTTKGPSSRRN